VAALANIITAASFARRNQSITLPLFSLALIVRVAQIVSHDVTVERRPRGDVTGSPVQSSNNANTIMHLYHPPLLIARNLASPSRETVVYW